MKSMESIICNLYQWNPWNPQSPIFVNEIHGIHNPQSLSMKSMESIIRTSRFFIKPRVAQRVLGGSPGSVRGLVHPNSRGEPSDCRGYKGKFLRIWGSFFDQQMVIKASPHLTWCFLCFFLSTAKLIYLFSGRKNWKSKCMSILHLENLRRYIFPGFQNWLKGLFAGKPCSWWVKKTRHNGFRRKIGRVRFGWKKLTIFNHSIDKGKDGGNLSDQKRS